MDTDSIIRVATRAAYNAGDVLKKHFGKLDSVNKKHAIDLVTVADVESEETIVDTIRSAFPDHAILAEEGGMHRGDPDNCWIVDPLDGTTNFAHNLPIFSISIAFSHQRKTKAGIVFNPISGEFFSAALGRGAQLNHRPIRVSTTTVLEDSLLATGLPYNLHQTISELMQRFRNAVCACRGIRRLGSAALDLCYLACGRFDGFWEQNLKPWDMAAGVLITQEAGGQVTDFEGQFFDLDGGRILATNGHVHSELTALLNLEDFE